MSGGFGSQPVGDPVQPCPLGQGADARPRRWIEIELVDEDDQPVAGEEFRVRLPDGQEVTGTLDADGHARIDGLRQGGTCQVCFPQLDEAAWSVIETAAARDG
ncbi:hypothetical protein ACQ5SO_16930 [Rhodovulum sp. DZ06]|uniref:hypothetical protein n=1 Tax=Rhodovulum sp. DZ06 TaxID=3425126 RepID=UPI003D34989A